MLGLWLRIVFEVVAVVGSLQWSKRGVYIHFVHILHLIIYVMFRGCHLQSTARRLGVR